MQVIHEYQGIIIRSRFPIDKLFIDQATQLQFIARVGAGLESIDCEYAQEKNITLIAAPEGNSNAVGEHALGMLLNLFNNLNQANAQIRQGFEERLAKDEAFRLDPQARVDYWMSFLPSQDPDLFKYPIMRSNGLLSQGRPARRK